MRRSLFLFFLAALLLNGCSEPSSGGNPPSSDRATVTINIVGLPLSEPAQGVQLEHGALRYSFISGVAQEVEPGAYTLRAKDRTIPLAGVNSYEYYSASDGIEVTVVGGERRTIEVPFELSRGLLTAEFLGLPAGLAPTMNFYDDQGDVVQLGNGESIQLPTRFAAYAVSFTDAVDSGTLYGSTTVSFDAEILRNEETVVTVTFEPVPEGWRQTMRLPGSGTSRKIEVFPLSDSQFVALLGDSLTNFDLAKRVAHRVAFIQADRAILLSTGQVLSVGGFNTDGPGTYIRDVVLTNIDNGEQTNLAPLNSARPHHSITELNDGRILLAGGHDHIADTTTGMRSIELYDLVTETSRTIQDAMSEPRLEHTAIMLGDGRVLLFGGTQTGSTHNIDVYDPSTDEIAVLTSFAANIRGANGVAVGNTLYVVANQEITGVDLVTGDKLPNPGVLLATGPYHPGVSALDDGRILVTGGAAQISGLGSVRATEIYNPSTGLVVPGPQLAGPLRLHAQLLDGASVVTVSQGWVQQLRLPLAAP